MRWCFLDLSHLLFFTAFSLLVGKPSGFRICSYNVQKFNPEKAANERLLHTITRIVSYCDICLLLHVDDPEGTAINTLVSKLNSYDEDQYKAVSSGRLGKEANDMQQYVFIYRAHMVNVTAAHQYNGQGFVRPPFAVQFQSNKTAINEFVLVPLHSNPDQAVQEIDLLYDVFQEVSTMWDNLNVMLLGDFHASCAYVTRDDRKKIRLFTNSSFSWLIGDRVDTTVTDGTSCAYDRIVVHGQPFLRAIKPYSGKVFNFGKTFKLEKRWVMAISEHFPVEVRLKSSALLPQATPLLTLLGVFVTLHLFL